LPGAVCIFTIYQEILNFTGFSDFDDRYVGDRLLDGYILSVAALHLVMLCIGFRNFRIQRMK
jgi:hypothetical protein